MKKLALAAIGVHLLLGSVCPMVLRAEAQAPAACKTVQETCSPEEHASHAHRHDVPPVRDADCSGDCLMQTSPDLAVFSHDSILPDSAFGDALFTQALLVAGPPSSARDDARLALLDLLTVQQRK